MPISEDFHCTGYDAIHAHIMFSIVMFNLHILFKSGYGRRFCEKSLSVKLAPGFEKTYIIVYYENYFGIFDIKEYTELITSEQVFTPP